MSTVERDLLKLKKSLEHFKGIKGSEKLVEILEKEIEIYEDALRVNNISDEIECIKNEIGELPIIAEDLGFLDSNVRGMLRESGFPGMKVLQFAFDSREDNDYLPHNYTRNCVIYTGTHDNDTIIGWINSAPKENLDRAKQYFGLPHDSDTPRIAEAFIRAAFSGVGDTAIVPMQDILGLGSEARMNLPSSVEGNWRFRLSPDYLTKIDRAKLREYTELYGR